ncbi:potA [Acrasis kona]|uniref:PotA n=1 Tax=Acrasis kona TaxID=1008807 RepID=A0AAW2ZLQ1_9EUKA
MNIIRRGFEWQRQNVKLALWGYATLVGIYASYLTIENEKEEKQRRRNGIYKDHHRANKRRIINGLEPLPDDAFSKKELVEGYKQWKIENKIKD